MNIKIITPKGIEFEKENIKYIQIFDKKGLSFGMLNSHLPVISTIGRGYVMVETDDDKDYIALSSGVMRNKNDEVTVTCESALVAKTKDEAVNGFEEMLESRREENRERNIELALAENELRKEIKKTGAGKL